MPSESKSAFRGALCRQPGPPPTTGLARYPPFVSPGLCPSPACELPQIPRFPASTASRAQTAAGACSTPQRNYGVSSSAIRSMLTPRNRHVSSRIHPSNRATACGAVRPFGCLPFGKRKTGNFRSHGRATALFCWFPGSLRLLIRHRQLRKWILPSSARHPNRNPRRSNSWPSSLCTTSDHNGDSDRRTSRRPEP
jgi:hypothetical protein